MPRPDILASASVSTALETPQILVSWAHKQDSYWNDRWEACKLQRKYGGFPVSSTDGTNLLNEPYSSTINRSFSDLTLDGLRYSYYGLFYQYKTKADAGFLSSGGMFNIKRQFSKVTGVAKDETLSGEFLWFSGIDQRGVPTCVLVDYRASVNAGIDYGYITRKLDLSAVAQTYEKIVSIARVGTYDTKTVIALVTNQRLLVIDIANDTVESTDVLFSENLSDVLTKNYTISDITGYFSGGEVYFVILDSANQEIVTYDTATVTPAVLDYSGLSFASSVSCVEYDAEGIGSVPHIVLSYFNHIVRLDPASSPWTDGDIADGTMTPFYIGGASITFNSAPGDYFLGFWDEESGDYYHLSDTSFPAMNKVSQTDWYDPDGDTFGLFHLNEAEGASSVVNSVGANATNVNCVEGREGIYPLVYPGCYETPLTTAYVDADSIADNLDAEGGTIEFWYKPITSFWQADEVYLFHYTWNDGGANTAEIALYVPTGEAGTIRASYKYNTTEIYVDYTPVTQDDDWHHYAIKWTNSGTQTLYFEVDSNTVGTSSITFAAWSGGSATLSLCGSSGEDSAQGYYDEIRCSTINRDQESYSMFWHKAALLHDWSGRDYSTTNFEFRDQLFFDFVPEAIRDRDVRLSHLSPDLAISTGEVLHRGGRLQNRGQLSVLLRLFGLLLDRNVDNRMRVLEDICIDDTAYRYIDKFSELIGYSDVRNILDPCSYEEIELRRLKQIVKGVVQVWRRKGTINGFKLFLKLYHIALDATIYYRRRYWDSVINPDRQDVYLDSQFSHLDSSAWDSPISDIALKAYYTDHNISSGTNGVTPAVAADRTFVSTGQTWLSTPILVGDMIHIFDEVDQGANGQWVIDEVVNDTQVKINQDWPTEAVNLSGLTFEIWKRIPASDPMAEFVVNFLNQLRPFNVSLVYVD